MSGALLLQQRKTNEQINYTERITRKSNVKEHETRNTFKYKKRLAVQELLIYGNIMNNITMYDGLGDAVENRNVDSF